MTLEEKRELIAQNRDPTIAAITSVIDTHYNLLAPVSDNGIINENKFNDEKSLNFAKGLQTDVAKHEEVLMKVKKNEELSAKDIAYIGICYDFCAKRAETQILAMAKAKVLCTDLAEKLSSNVNKSAAADSMRKLIQRYESKT